MKSEFGEYSPTDYKERVGVFIEGMIQLVNALDTVGSTYVMGSLGRRLAMMRKEAQIESVNDYFRVARGRMVPRQSEKGGWDVDVGVSDGDITWPDLATLARKVTMQFPGLEVDPRLMKIDRENDVETMVSLSPVCGLRHKLRLDSISIELREGLDVRVPDLPAQLGYYFACQRLRAKDVSEIAYLTRFIQENRASIAQPEEVRLLAIGYMFSHRLPIDAIRIIYQSVVPRKIRNLIRVATGRTPFNPMTHANFNSPVPLYF